MAVWKVDASFLVTAPTSDRAEEDLAEYLDAMPPEYGIRNGEVYFGKSVPEREESDEEEGSK